jgi:mRNA-degrading endonuclease HigB of HigAB toxin-antitoxin module
MFPIREHNIYEDHQTQHIGDVLDDPSGNGAFAEAMAADLHADRARFEIAGGNYRMIVAFDFAHQVAWIKFLGTHDEYDAIDALSVAMF